MESYMEYKTRVSKELEAFPMAFAFSDKQLEEALAKLNATLENCLNIGGGGLIRKSDRVAFVDMMMRHTMELTELMKDDAFLTDAMQYELSNHEYCITGDPEDALAVLGLEYESLNEEQMACFNRAREQYERSIVNW